MFLNNALPPDYVLAGELDSDLAIPDFDRLREEVLPRHPLLRQAANHREAAGQQLKASQFSWIPDPVFSATSAKELDGDIFLWGFGFEVPLWNQSRAASQRDRETLRQAEYLEEGLFLDLQAQLMIHHNHLLLHRQVLQLFQEGLLDEAEVSMEIAETSYREGEISLVEYLDARRTFQSIQIEFQRALYDWNRELAELNRAAGGGIL
jgi:cobalt-zinc-cadmium efflux system outer membrane protein